MQPSVERNIDRKTSDDIATRQKKKKKRKYEDSLSKICTYLLKPQPPPKIHLEL